MTLRMECEDEPLSAAQLAVQAKTQEHYKKVKSMLETLVKDKGGSLVCQSGVICGYEYTLPSAAPPQPVAPIHHLESVAAQPMLNVSKPSSARGQPQTIKLNVMNPNATNVAQGQNIQLVMDPRMGVILGSVASPQGSPAAAQVTKQVANIPTATTQVRAAPVVTATPPPLVSKPMQAKSAVNLRPSEQNSVGGISIGNKALEQSDANKGTGTADNKEVAFNKINGGRTYPSLVVVARPHLKTKTVAAQVVQKERSDLDMKVKGILMYSAVKFTEWLIQQGLVRSEQICKKHSYNGAVKKLKLGMYSDAGTFPYSGGYVWISGCCPDRFVSVFYGSIFQNALQSPTTILKLIYHWSCQTNVQNVISWVKVSNLYVKNFYANLRSVCTAAICDKFKKMGGKTSTVQVGVISLGTTSQDGNMRQVKVEVLGILDPDTMEIRLRACEPVRQGDKSYKKRFTNILSPLSGWVYKETKILTDFTVDKTTLFEMGFHNVSQSTFSDQNSKNHTSNYHIMEYLRKIVPRMFQNTLSLLSRPIIQQFLDELVWREMYGVTPLRAFENIIAHISEQTKIESTESLVERFAKIADNPFRNWSYSGTTVEPAPVATAAAQGPMVTIPQNFLNQINSEAAAVKTPPPKVTNRRGKRTFQPDNEIIEEAVVSDPKVPRITDLVSIHEHYYATMKGTNSSKKISEINFQCFLCSAVLKTNTEVMEHIISHVPPQVPDQAESLVCRYCCTAFSSRNQMNAHIPEAHSEFGRSDSDMVVCAICEQKFGGGQLLIQHLAQNHSPSEVPYKCQSCGYRTSSHKDAIDHYYAQHEKSTGLQCPYCLKVIEFVTEKGQQPSLSSVHAYLMHMQRHLVRRDNRRNKCSRCCLWFNQTSILKAHVSDHHPVADPTKLQPYILKDKTKEKTFMVSRVNSQGKRFFVSEHSLQDQVSESVKRWTYGKVSVNAPGNANFSCQECEEDIDVTDHYPGEQKCGKCRYITCCWRAYKEHQKQIHNERPMMCVAVPSPLINIPLEKEMRCSCGFTTLDGNGLATHLIKCKKLTAYPSESFKQN